jgi:hypothetical protein
VKKLIPLTLAAAFAAGTALAGGDHAAQFKQLDANANGTIEKSELQGHPEAMKQFTQADANGNGKLEQGEFASIELTGDDAPGHSESSTSRDSSHDMNTDKDKGY